MCSANPLVAKLGRGRAAWPQLALWAGLGCGMVLLAATTRFARDHALMLNLSPSLPHWAVWLDRTALPQRGDLAVFLPPRSELLRRHFGPKPPPFAKQVLGMAGDRVTERGRTFYVNGAAVAYAKPASRHGEPLALGPTGVIPAGCLFVAAPHKDSFDSRYAAIGWICRPQVLGKGTAVL